MHAMNNKKVVLFSTRTIQNEGIFEDFKRKNPNDSLQKYFKSSINQPSLSDNLSDKIQTWKNKLINKIVSYNAEKQAEINALLEISNIQLCIESIINVIEKNDDLRTEGENILNEFDKEIKEQLDLNSPYSENIDATGKTIADRISLFQKHGFSNEFAIYAVWPLRDSCNDDSWVSTLTNAIMTEEPNCDEIILWIHDDDLEQTKKSTFRVRYYQKDECIKNKNIKVSLGVFQHPDHEFQNVLFITPNDEKTIYNAIDFLFSSISKMISCNKKNVLEGIYNSLANQKDRI